MKNTLKLTCLTLAVSLLATVADAATIKIATLSPDGSAWMKTMKAAGDEIYQKTEQRVKFRFYPGGVMGNDKAVLKKIRIGQLQGAAISGGALATYAPDTQVYNLPMLFQSYEQVDYVRAKIDKDIMQDFEKAGWVNFGLAEAGFAFMMSKNPIVTPDDLKQNKVWVPSNDPASEAAAESFGIAPTPLHLGDVLAGLQTGLVNAVTTSPIAAIALQWHTQVDYINNLPLVYLYGILAIDKKAFDKKISAEDQKIVREVMGKAFKTIDTQNREDNKAAYAAILEQGIKELSPNAVEQQQWRDKTQQSIALFLKKGGISQQAYDKITAVANEYKAP
jgi:TRAP-type C4-dicarboxylate transport system substrate-binding protein